MSGHKSDRFTRVYLRTEFCLTGIFHSPDGSAIRPTRTLVIILLDTFKNKILHVFYGLQEILIALLWNLKWDYHYILHLITLGDKIIENEVRFCTHLLFL